MFFFFFRYVTGKKNHCCALPPLSPRVVRPLPDEASFIFVVPSEYKTFAQYRARTRCKRGRARGSDVTKKRKKKKNNQKQRADDRQAARCSLTIKFVSARSIASSASSAAANAITATASAKATSQNRIALKIKII